MLSQLLEHFDSIVDMLQTGANVDVIYYDVAETFDKLKELGIVGNVLEWIKACKQL